MRLSLSRLARAATRSPLSVLGLWAVLVLAVQRWPSWEEGIRVQFAADTRFYEVIARAAPSFPSTEVLRSYAERFPTHWLVGSVADATEAPLHGLYRAADVVCIGLVLLAVHGALGSLRLGLRERAVALGAVAASAYPVHYLLAAPGMLSDGVFVLGLSLTLLGFTRSRLALVVAGLVVATIGRQTALPVALAASAWTFASPAWRHARWRAVLLCALVPGAVHLVLREAAGAFAMGRNASFSDLTVLGFLTGPRPFAEHLGRVALGIVVPCALVLGAWLRTRDRLPRGPLLLAAAVAVQPLLLGPVSNGGNEPRLAGLAAPALAVAAGTLLRGARLGRGETAALAAALAAGGLHHRYTHAGVPDNVAWATLELVAAVVVVAVLARRPLAARWAAARAAGDGA